MYKVTNFRKGQVGCSCERKGKTDFLLLKHGLNEVEDQLWEAVLKGNSERYAALEAQGLLSWRKVEEPQPQPQPEPEPEPKPAPKPKKKVSKKSTSSEG